MHETNERESVSDSVGLLIRFNDKKIDDIGDKEGDILPRKMHMAVTCGKSVYSAKLVRFPATCSLIMAVLAH